jgi:GAF domain-containing protein
MLQVAALTGFERIILSDRNGQPIASNGKLESAIGCEVVKQAKLIADRESEPVALLGDETSKLLSRAAYLAPAGEECERFERLGLAAALNLPLRIDGELVAGLHAFHSAPRRTGAERRSVAHLFAERLVARMARHGWTP